MSGIEGHLETLLDFMRVLCPSYFLAVAIASGSSSSLIFYNIVLFLIYVVEVLILRFLLPVINIYIMVQVLNYLAGEEYLSQFAELLSKMVTWILKTLVTCVIGINVIQGMLAPAIDALKRSALTKTAEAIPGIGNAIGGVTDVVLGTAVLIKKRDWNGGSRGYDRYLCDTDCTDGAYDPDVQTNRRTGSAGVR